MSRLISRPPSIIFDLDGTLVETADDIVAALNVSVAPAGIAPLPVDLVRTMIGAGARRLIERAVGHAGVAAPVAAVDAALVRFLDHYRAHIADESRPFPGIVPCLDWLKERGALLGVCTNKLEADSRDLLDRLGLGPYFGAVLGGDSLAVKKPDAGHILGVIERLGGDPAHALMVGDSETDVNGARNAGVPVVAVTWGYTAVPAAELGADALVEHPEGLIPAIARLACLPAPVA
jgi:phosphoglycolate phosphatase